ncbi:S1C family serine protease [Allofournierella sp.]|uniref:S1C family serine protease n=1 Tax=Allofournierella sp. TaxID=1940256 RepID=UPI002E7601E1|nr:trypsin-like peptidase domain-containing protein [Fournierella sp.]MEE0755657.1 trypsin-like peptidase domain-containing protein [Fournierella sp.]
MENKWEYDYSGLYQNGYNPAPPTGSGPSGQMPGDGGMPGAPMGGGEPPRKKRGIGKKVLAGVLALVLVAAVSFGGGFAGYLVASKNGGQTVMYQAASGGSATSTSSTGGSLSDVASAVTPSVVVVTTEQIVTDNYFWGGQQVLSGAGSGVILTTDGYIVTNYHVVEGAQQITVTLHDDSTYTATVVGSDQQSDIALLKIDATGLTPAVLGNSDSVQVGEVVIAVGNPMGTLGGTVTDGIVSALNRDISVEGNEMTLMQTSAAISPGNSGGGLFNTNGELIGIVNAKYSDEDAEGLGFAIPVNTMKTVVQDLLENGYVTGRPALGITVITVGDVQTAMQYGVSSLGVYVNSVDEGSGAEAAGMKAGDRIVSIGTQLVESTDDVTNALKSYNVGDVVEVQVDRGRELITLQVTLGEKTGA